MAYDMFRCPKCKSIIFDYDWTMVSDDEEGFVCTQCDIVYSGKELSRLINEFENEIKPDEECSSFADWEE